MFGKVTLAVDPVGMELGKGLVRGGAEHYLNLDEIVQHVLRPNDVDLRRSDEVVLEMAHAVSFSRAKDFAKKERANIILWLRWDCLGCRQRVRGRRSTQRVCILRRVVWCPL